MDLSNVVNVIYAILGVGFLIFVHELGHFLAAKKVGIRVHTFCVGFQPVIFGFRARFFAFQRGETEYALGMIPFGGYVKMAGEDPTDNKTGSADEFSSKTVGERALVLVAGAVMNLIFGFLFFMLAFTVGVKSQEPVVGDLAAGSPAWKAGLRPGDRILTINGEEKKSLDEVAATVALAGLENPIELKASRPNSDGSETVMSLSLQPVKDSGLGLPTIGVGRAPASKFVGAVLEGSPAEKAGIAEGDELGPFTVVDKDGTRFEIPSTLPWWRQWSLVSAFTYQKRDGAQLMTTIRNSEGTKQVTMTLEPHGEPVNQIGLAPQIRVVGLVQPHSPAAEVFSVGQEIVRVANQTVHHIDEELLLRVAPQGGPVAFETTTGQTGQVDRDQWILWLGSQLHFFSASRRVEKVVEKGVPQGLGVAVGHQLLLLDGKAFLQPSQWVDLSLGSHTVTWWDGAKQQSASFDVTESNQSQVSGSLTFDSRVTVGKVYSGAPAALAGLKPGDLVTKINGETVTSFRGVSSGVTGPPASWWQFGHSPPETVDIEVSRDGSTQSFQVKTQGQLALAGLTPRISQVVIQTSVGDAVVLGGQRAYQWVGRIFQTFRALFRREVDAKNLAGPIGIFDISRRVVEYGLGRFLFVLGLISINLGILNLMPFPILDGGHLLFLAIEKVKGSPVSDRIQGLAFTVAFVMLIGLALFVTFHDLRRLL